MTWPDMSPYFNYLQTLWEEIRNEFISDEYEFKRMVFDKAASPYHYWLQNETLPKTPPQAASEHHPAASPPKHSEAAHLIREGLRSKVKANEGRYSFLTEEAFWALHELVKAVKERQSDTWFKTLDRIPDDKLTAWKEEYRVML